MVTTKKSSRAVSSKKTTRSVKKVMPKKTIRTRAASTRREVSVKRVSKKVSPKAAVRKSVNHSLVQNKKQKVSTLRVMVLFVIIAGLLAIFAFVLARRTEAPSAIPIDVKQDNYAPTQAQNRSQQLGIRLKYPAKLNLERSTDQQSDVKFMLVAPEPNNKKIAMQGRVFENVPTDKFPYRDVQRFIEEQKSAAGTITSENRTKWYCLENDSVKRCLAQRDKVVFELEYPLDQENPMLPEEFNGVVSGTQL